MAMENPILSCGECKTAPALVKDLVNKKWLCVDCAAAAGCPDAIAIKTMQAVDQLLAPAQEVKGVH